MSYPRHPHSDAEHNLPVLIAVVCSNRVRFGGSEAVLFPAAGFAKLKVEAKEWYETKRAWTNEKGKHKEDGRRVSERRPAKSPSLDSGSPSPPDPSSTASPNTISSSKQVPGSYVPMTRSRSARLAAVAAAGPACACAPKRELLCLPKDTSTTERTVANSSIALASPHPSAGTRLQDTTSSGRRPPLSTPGRPCHASLPPPPHSTVDAPVRVATPPAPSLPQTSCALLSPPESSVKDNHEAAPRSVSPSIAAPAHTATWTGDAQHNAPQSWSTSRTQTQQQHSRTTNYLNAYTPAKSRCKALVAAQNYVQPGAYLSHTTYPPPTPMTALDMHFVPSMVVKHAATGTYGPPNYAPAHHALSAPQHEAYDPIAHVAAPISTFVPVTPPPDTPVMSAASRPLPVATGLYKTSTLHNLAERPIGNGDWANAWAAEHLFGTSAFQNGLAATPNNAPETPQRTARAQEHST